MTPDKLTQKDAILSVLFLLGDYDSGANKLIDLESLTVGCFRLFKAKFSMEKFPEYPRIDRVYKRMNELVKQALVRKHGDSRYGLTNKGITYVKNHSHLLESVRARFFNIQENLSNIKNQDLSTEDVQREMAKLKRTTAFEKFTLENGNNITLQDYLDYLKIDIYAQATPFMRRYKRIQKISEQDRDLNKLFLIMRQKFGESYIEIRKNVQSLMGE